MSYAQISKYRHVTARLYFFSKVKIKSWLASNSFSSCMSIKSNFICRWCGMHFNLLHKDCNLKTNCSLGPSYFAGCVSGEIRAH